MVGGGKSSSVTQTRLVGVLASRVIFGPMDVTNGGPEGEEEEEEEGEGEKERRGRRRKRVRRGNREGYHWLFLVTLSV